MTQIPHEKYPFDEYINSFSSSSPLIQRGFLYIQNSGVRQQKIRAARKSNVDSFADIYMKRYSIGMFLLM